MTAWHLFLSTVTATVLNFQSVMVDGLLIVEALLAMLLGYLVGR